MIRLRIDVDYPYPSRIRSFIYTTLNIKTSKDYLKNSKIVAKMINDSQEEVKAFWFFTPKTIPDKELLALIDNDKHEVSLHVVNNPNAELQMLERITGKKINYYTIHGTARLLARIMWKRWKVRAPKIPNGFPVQSFHQFPTEGLDSLCYLYPIEQAVTIAEDCIRKGCVMYFHPIWLFQRGKMNYRGPFYESLKRILEVDKDLETLTVRKKIFFTIARDAKEYERDIIPTEKFNEKLRERGVDIFTFLERRWCFTLTKASKSWLKANDNVALLQVTTYNEWLRNVGKKTRNMIRKAEKNGIRTETVEVNEKLAEGIWKIYNETPIRQERGFSHYGTLLGTVKESLLSSQQNCSYIGAFLQDELVGFVQLVHGNNITMISQILSLQRYWDKAVSNALVAKTVEVCANEGVEWIMYGRVGNHPSLDRFKGNNGFTQFLLTRYYIPLTRKGRIVAKLGLHREAKDALPQSVKRPLFPLYNWISRARMRIRLLGTSKTVL